MASASVTGRNAQGFTLIELMMVVAVIAIIASIGYPSYVKKVRETHRKEAIGQVLDLAAHVERLKSQTFSYQNADGQSRSLSRYDIDITADAASYTITATPSGDQSEDPCGTFTYTNEATWEFDSGNITEDECVN